MAFRMNANEEKFTVVELFGKKVLYTPSRIDRATVPDGLFMYEIRYSSDEEYGTLEKRVACDFESTIISDYEFALDEIIGSENHNISYKTISYEDIAFLYRPVSLRKFFNK